jgi:tetratricopeptide (TPR) repeat protein
MRLILTKSNILSAKQSSKPKVIKPSGKVATPMATGISWLHMGDFSPGSLNKNQLLTKLFWGIAALSMIWMLFTAWGTGINGDDKMQNEYEQALISWYSTGGADTTALNLPATKMHYYGGLFEVVSGATNRVLGFDSPDELGYHKVRHLWNALFGWAALLFIGLTAVLLLGWEAGIVAILMGLLSPRFIGHGVMNPKDIPFATGYIMSLYFILRWLKEMPRPGKGTIAGLLIAIGLAIGVRAGGVIVVAIFGLFAVLHFIGKFGLSGFVNQPKALKSYLLYGIIPVAGGLVISILFWPFAMQSPVKHIMESLAELSNYGVNIRLLFNDQMVFAQSLPMDYLPRWVWVTVPLFVFLGWLASLVSLGKLVKWVGSIPVMMLFFAFVFPFVYVIYKDSTLYDGWRHLIFPYTAGLVVAAMGLYAVASYLPEKKWFKPMVYGIAGLLAVHPLWHMVSNPYLQYVYFNQIQGGVAGALGSYETDYWGVSVKQGLKELERQGIIGENMDKEVVIATNFAYPLEKYASKYGGKVKPVYVRYRQRHDAAWDYGLFASRFVDSEYIKKGYWPPANSIGNITVSGTPVLSITKQENDAAFRGISLQKQNKFGEAIPLLEQAVKQDPGDEVAWCSLAFSYMNSNQNELAASALDKTLEIDPDNITALSYYGLFHINQNNLEAAIRSFEKAVAVQDNNFFPYYYLSMLEQQRNNLSVALEYGKNAVTYNPRFKAGYEQVAKVYEAMGDPANAEAYMKAASQIN